MIDIAVCYHKQAPVFQSDALKPIHLGKALSKVDLGFRGDDTGDNISTKNKWYAEETGFYWLWKNSGADIKGIMHYRRLLDLRLPNGKDKDLALEDIKPDNLVAELGLNEENISEIMKNADVIIRKRQDIHDWFDGNMEEQYKACHIPEHLDYVMDIIKRDFPEIETAAKSVLADHFGYFANLVIMKSPLFDVLCEFKFGVLEKLGKMVDVSRPEIADGWQYTARYAGFIGERLTMFYIEYLRRQGKKIAEFTAVNIAPRETAIWDDKNYGAGAYLNKNASNAIEPVFGKDSITAMMAANDKYAPYAAVMLQSIIDNANPNKNYDIVIAGSDITDKNRQTLESMARSNVSVRIINVNKIVDSIGSDVFSTHLHFTIETYYRFFIPELFAKYDKVLYLDCDMVVLRDIADLYETDIGENWWGVVREILISVLGFTDGTFEKHEFLPYIKNTLKIDSPFDYFQAGVMVWNIKECIKDDVMDKLLTQLKEIGKPHYVDQDVMASLANGKHIHWLPQNWNVAWNVSFHWYKGEGREAYKTAIHLLDNPFILHYSSNIKPWIELDRPNADKFWKYARKTPFYEIFLQKITQVPQTYIRKYKRKILKYKILQFLTLGLIPAFRIRKNKYRAEIKQVEETRRRWS